jgi:hypothetical protein
MSAARHARRHVVVERSGHMPSKDRVEALIARVEAGKFVEALETFYASDASMQENHEAPRPGLPALVENERRFLSVTKEMRGRATRPFFIAGDHAVINWVFEFVDPAGRARRLDELAYQRWSGDKIVEERFYYDPVQLRG